jgi:hypothetical protein
VSLQQLRTGDNPSAQVSPGKYRGWAIKQGPPSRTSAKKGGTGEGGSQEVAQASPGVKEGSLEKMLKTSLEEPIGVGQVNKERTSQEGDLCV